MGKAEFVEIIEKELKAEDAGLARFIEVNTDTHERLLMNEAIHSFAVGLLYRMNGRRA